MPFQSRESVAVEQLVRVELGDRGPGLENYEVFGLIEVLADPASVL